MPAQRNKVLVIGGGGYVGAALVPHLLARGHAVRVLDLFMYGHDVLDGVRDNPELEIVTGDLRDLALMERCLQGCDHVVHLACISNDPSFDLDPELGRSINFEAFEPCVRIARDASVQRFVFASSSSVYGVKDEPRVTEDLPLEPITDYARYKVLCEEVLFRYTGDRFVTVAIRPSTVCGYSPRQRLDILLNILTNHAVNLGRVKVIGRDLKRPSIHIQDIVELYERLLHVPAASIRGKVFNAGYQNHTVQELAEMVKRRVGPDTVEIRQIPTDDIRSYHIDSGKIERELGFVPGRTIEQAVGDLVAAFEAGLLPDSLTDPRYFNIETMKRIGLR